MYYINIMRSNLELLSTFHGSYIPEIFDQMDSLLHLQLRI